MSYRAYHDHDDDRVYALGVGSGGAGESYIPFCLSGVQGAVQDALGEAEFDGAVRGLLVDHEAWEGLDKRAVSTVLVNIVDMVSKRVFT